MTTTLAPGLLLAAPQLGDPNFDRTVVLLGHHDAEGALGWVLNGRAIAPVGDLLRGSGILPDGEAVPRGASFSRAARVGGPVQPESGWLLYRMPPGEPVGEQLVIGSGLAVSSDGALLAAVARGERLTEFRLVVGYAGWGAGQLEREVQRGSWLPAPLDLALVLEADAEELWDRAYKQTIGLGAGAFVATRGGSA